MQPMPRFWAHENRTATGVDEAGRPREFTLSSWGGSLRSIEDAAAVARRRLEALARHVAGSPLPSDWYYPAQVVREEVLEDLVGPDGALLGQITRNRYGAQVLNTDAVLIADIDLPAPAGRRRGLRGLFARAPEAPAVDPAEQTARESIAAFAARHPGWGVHTHRTAGGFRVLVTGTGVTPVDGDAERILSELASDPLYVRLCAAQGTYRARLTPKPWRIGIRGPASALRWPVEGERERRYRAWVEEYSRRSGPWAVCRREAWNGVEPSAAERLVLELHDRVTAADSGAALA